MKTIKYVPKGHLLHTAFTMIELVFVIVVLGILSAVAIPKLSSSIEDANLATGIATVGTIRSAIASERQSNLIKGQTAYPLLLDEAGTGDDEALFGGNKLANGDFNISIMQYPIYSGTDSGDWKKTTDNSGAKIGYRYYIGHNKYVDFNYTKSSGYFDCNHANENCKLLMQR